MSLAVLARKTKTKQRLRSTTCGGMRNGSRTRGFVLNMTGRGQVIGSGAKYNSGGCRGLTGTKCGYGCSGCCEVGCKGGQRYSCCGANKAVDESCRKNCKLCWYQGLSQPAPQMSYGVYLARKSSGAHRPSGRACCDCALDCDPNIAANPRKNPNTWKQSPNLSAGTVIEKNRLAAIKCAQQQITYKETILGGRCISKKRTARWPCTIYDARTRQYIQAKCNPLGPPCTRYLNCGAGIKSRLAYPRINNNNCTTTKAIGVGRSASEQIALRKSGAMSCQCWTDPVAYMTIGYRRDLNNPNNDYYGYSDGAAGLPPPAPDTPWSVDFGRFSGTIRGIHVYWLTMFLDETPGPTPPAQLLLILPLNSTTNAANFLKSLSFVASDGTSVSITVENEGGGGGVFVKWGNTTVQSDMVSFFKNHVGQCVKVYWTPETQDLNGSQYCGGPVENPEAGGNLKCQQGSLFKNPSKACPQKF